MWVNIFSDFDIISTVSCLGLGALIGVTYLPKLISWTKKSNGVKSNILPVEKTQITMPDSVSSVEARKPPLIIPGVDFYAKDLPISVILPQKNLTPVVYISKQDRQLFYEAIHKLKGLDLESVFLLKFYIEKLSRENIKGIDYTKKIEGAIDVIDKLSKRKTLDYARYAKFKEEYAQKGYWRDTETKSLNWAFSFNHEYKIIEDKHAEGLKDLLLPLTKKALLDAVHILCDGDTSSREYSKHLFRLEKRIFPGFDSKTLDDIFNLAGNELVCFADEIKWKRREKDPSIINTLPLFDNYTESYYALKTEYTLNSQRELLNLCDRILKEKIDKLCPPFILEFNLDGALIEKHARLLSSYNSFVNLSEAAIIKNIDIDDDTSKPIFNSAVNLLTAVEAAFVDQLNKYASLLKKPSDTNTSGNSDPLWESFLVKDALARSEFYNYFFKEELQAEGLNCYSRNIAKAFEAKIVLYQKARSFCFSKMEDYLLKLNPEFKNSALFHSRNNLLIATETAAIAHSKRVDFKYMIHGYSYFGTLESNRRFQEKEIANEMGLVYPSLIKIIAAQDASRFWSIDFKPNNSISDKFMLESSHTDTSNVGIIVDRILPSGKYIYKYKDMIFTIDSSEILGATLETININCIC